ncbi:MAG: hypothetical protein HY517_01110 [Candidatus Aenigmarchaeota archaeon]|nr:hypothetical protein [Candidatus Aenigmarchaeota archaeon]
MPYAFGDPLAIRATALYRSVLPPDILRAIMRLTPDPDMTTLPNFVEEAIEKYLSKRGVAIEERQAHQRHE